MRLVDGGSGGLLLANFGPLFFSAVPVACCCIAIARCCCMLLHCHRLAETRTSPTAVVLFFQLDVLCPDSYFIDSGISELS